MDHTRVVNTTAVVAANADLYKCRRWSVRYLPKIMISVVANAPALHRTRALQPARMHPSRGYMDKRGDWWSALPRFVSSPTCCHSYCV